MIFKTCDSYVKQCRDKAAAAKKIARVINAAESSPLFQKIRRHPNLGFKKSYRVKRQSVHFLMELFTKYHLIMKNPKTPASLYPYFSQWFSPEQLKERAQLFCETINSQPKTVLGRQTHEFYIIYFDIKSIHESNENSLEKPLS